MPFKPKKSLGQVFLKNTFTKEKIIEIVRDYCKDKEEIIEIGAGEGQFTEELVSISKSVYAIEVDPSLIDLLKERFKKYKNIEIINQDILKIRFNEISSQKAVIFGAIPFNITGPLLIKFVKEKSSIKMIFIILQKEVALKIKATSGSKLYSFISALLQLFFDIEIVLNIPSTHFYPKPKVDACFVKFVPLNVNVEGVDDFIAFLRKVFNHRRKKIINILNFYIKEKEKIIKILQSLSLPLSVRPQEIPPEKLMLLYKKLIKLHS